MTRMTLYYIRKVIYILVYTVVISHQISSRQSSSSHKIDAVMLTTGKDLRVFEKSLESAINHLVDVNMYYIITPQADYLRDLYRNKYQNRVKYIDESLFPYRYQNITEVMYEAVKERGLYDLNGKSPFEHTLYSRTGWFIQQVLKMYAGKVLQLNDYVLLDSDIVWFKNISFVAASDSFSNTAYYYTTSNQYHPQYYSSMKKIIGFGLPKQKEHRSGITHHMVIKKSVMDDLMRHSEELHGGLPFWKIMLNQSAIEMTCRAPKSPICGAGSTLSEYEIYFNFARVKHPSTVVYRPLLWANGPYPGLLFWPETLESDGPKSNWRGHKQAEVPEIFNRQISIDACQGYDYIGYHGYAKRRYFEIVWEDMDYLCKNAKPIYPNTTCSWNKFEDSTLPMTTWFQGCACYMANHQAGP